jgi:hypothetical protein
MAWDDAGNVFQLVPVPTRTPNRCWTCGTQSGADGPYAEALSIQLVDGTPAVCRRCMVGMLRLWGAVAVDYFTEVRDERDAARSEFADASLVRDEALRSVERLEAEVAAHAQEVADMTRLLRERDVQIQAKRDGRYDVPTVAEIAAQVKDALLEQPPPEP